MRKRVILPVLKAYLGYFTQASLNGTDTLGRKASGAILSVTTIDSILIYHETH